MDQRSPQEQREALPVALYDALGGSTSRDFNVNEAGESIGLDPDRASEMAVVLANSRSLGHRTYGGTGTCTPAGLREAERLKRSRPATPAPMSAPVDQRHRARHLRCWSGAAGAVLLSRPRRNLFAASAHNVLFRRGDSCHPRSRRSVLAPAIAGTAAVRGIYLLMGALDSYDRELLDLEQADMAGWFASLTELRGLVLSADPWKGPDRAYWGRYAIRCGETVEVLDKHDLRARVSLSGVDRPVVPDAIRDPLVAHVQEFSREQAFIYQLWLPAPTVSTSAR